MNNLLNKVEKGINTMREVSLSILDKRDMKDTDDALDVLKEKMESYIKEHPEKENIVETYDPDNGSGVKSVGLVIEDTFTSAYIRSEDFHLSFTKKFIEHTEVSFTKKNIENK